MLEGGVEDQALAFLVGRGCSPLRMASPLLHCGRMGCQAPLTALSRTLTVILLCPAHPAAGWAIEGAIGSEYKIDASYLSPHVNMASRLEVRAPDPSLTGILCRPAATCTRMHAHA